MKINEIITSQLEESFADVVKKFIPGTAANQQRAGTKSTAQLVKKAQQDWNKYVGQTGRKDIGQWAKDYFDRTNIPNPPTELNATNVQAFLTKLTQDFMWSELTDQEPDASVPDEPSVGGPTLTTGVEQTRPEKIPGVTVMGFNPPQVKFEKKVYIIGDKGRWVPATQRGTKAPSIQTALSALFDKATGHTSVAIPTNKSVTVTTPKGKVVTRGSNGKWIRQDDMSEVTDPDHIKKLNQLAINQKVLRQAGKGSTPSAAQPTEMPAVFASNRTPK